ncbi:cholinephosphate cytidylyltransferas-like protein [Lindgomyces ingoldianus]|uniref:Cholinephosphate cytidylyltransferas-like protein n=1 Tax=Lindgomyces ingoldianus TaxID=673940 RepID=A0ACB6QJH5_9PLEO|nr:cholinephosphate cytidylyltransferas-like protein [Lindgomyces ingoldianus]KAF2467109.1 cholinephosphate cytidylyltransferas-like protein [Lindgomyces ingoldianus]
MPPKRKRSTTVSSVKNSAMDIAQPSSRDASGEDAEDPVLQEIASKKERQNDASHVPSKRVRSTKNGMSDDGEDLDGTSRKSRRTSSSENNAKKAALDRAEHGENGEAGNMRMPDPPKAGLVDPNGYKTNPPPVGRPVRIYADGVFDLFHLGHMRQLQQAKTAFPDVYLIVGVTGDKETHRRKGLTVLSARERAESVRHCKWVDEVVEDCPWIIADAPEFIEMHKIDYVAHDDIPYGAAEGDDIYAPIKEKGMFLVTQRTEGLSTTGIITKIVRDYDQYIDRQLKRGTSRKELNISWLKKNELEIKRNMTELRDSIKANWTTTGQELSKDLKQFWQSSRPASPARTPTQERHEGALMPNAAVAASPSALSRLSHLDIPRVPSAQERGSSEFAAGYSLGLIGGVRAWMARSRRNLNDSRPQSPSSEGSSDDQSMKDPPRGRSGKQPQSDEMDVRA